MDFIAKWFKFYHKENIEPQETAVTGAMGVSMGIRNMIVRSMGDEDYFTMKFTEKEQEITINNMEHIVRLTRSIYQLDSWAEMKFTNDVEEHEEKL